jgi:hypothetical protein
MNAIPGPAFDAAYEEVRARYAHLVPALAPIAVPREVRPSVIYGWSRDEVPMEALVRAFHFQAHGLPIVLRGTPYEMAS